MTKNFGRSEFACRCGCGFDDIDVTLVNKLQALRDKLGVPVSISSGCRCAKRNKQVGGATNSQHLTGKAADIYSTRASMAALLQAVREVGFGGIGVSEEQGFIHVDVRKTTAIWSYKNGKTVAFNGLKRAA